MNTSLYHPWAMHSKSQTGRHLKACLQTTWYDVNRWVMRDGESRRSFKRNGMNGSPFPLTLTGVWDFHCATPGTGVKELCTGFERRPERILKINSQTYLVEKILTALHPMSKDTYSTHPYWMKICTWLLQSMSGVQHSIHHN